MSQRYDDDDEHRSSPTEQTRLLRVPSGKRTAKKPTPLPKLQLGILLLLQLIEPISSQSIYPYINELVAGLDITGGDEKKVGYYAGLIESLFFATEAMFVMHWSRLSDYTGRKPVLLIGTAGLCISMICFGLSKTYVTLVISRCLIGMLNGNVGVMKSMMGELTDSSNIAQGFSLLPIVWSAGMTIGPLIGGTLARPHDKWPSVFSHPFWHNYPYFLPCAAAASFAAVGFIVTAVFLKETVHKKRKTDKAALHTDYEPNTAECQEAQDDSAEPVPFRALLVRPVLISVVNYACLSLLEIAYRAIQPLFLSRPIALRGLAMDPQTIGLILGAFGVMNGLFQAAFFSRIIGRWGPKRVFMCGVATCAPLFALFAVISIVARRVGVNEVVWALVLFQLAMSVLMDMAFGSILIFLTSSAPNKRSLGATNGLAQLSASVMRTIGPAAATSLFSLSVEHKWLDGYGVYGIWIMLCCAALGVAAQLP